MKKILGFSLIELLVTTAVIGAVLTIGLANYTRINRQQIFRQSVKSTLEDLRLAQDKALSGEKPSDCLPPTEAPLTGYRFVFTDSQSYEIRAVCEGISGESICKAAALKGDVEKTTGPNSILFKVLGQGADLGGVSLRAISFTGYGLEEQIVITESGEIYLGPEPTETPSLAPEPSLTPGPTAAPTVTPTPTSVPLTTPTPLPTSTPAAENLIINPGFESGSSPWIFHTDGEGEFSPASPGYEGSRAGRVYISEPGSNVQLYQYNLALEPDTNYRLSFAAYSNTGHDFYVYIHKHGSPYTNYGLNAYRAYLGFSWGTFSVEFTSTSDAGSDARLRFWFAPFDASGDIYWIDRVELVRV